MTTKLSDLHAFWNGYYYDISQVCLLGARSFAQVRVCFYNDDRQEAERAAKMFAAAPDMLEAAQPLADLVEFFTGQDDDEIAVSAGELRRIAEAVRIAKEGRP